MSRLGWVDNLKGIGILLVLLGHVIIPEGLKIYIYSFHMPLFFFISGLFFSPKDSFKVFLDNKIKNIVYPYFFFGVISYLALIPLKFASNHFRNVDFKKSLLALFYGSHWNDLKLISNGALWFLTCLFCTTLLFYFINKIESNIKKLVLLIICSIFGYLILTYAKLQIILGLDRALIAVTFFGVAYLLKPYIFNKFGYEKFHFLIPIIAIFLNLTFGFLNHKVDLFYKTLGNYVYFYIAAFSGILFWVYIAKKITFHKIISYLGKNSLFLFATHLLSFAFIIGVFKKINYPLSSSGADLLKLNPHCSPFISDFILILFSIIIFIPISKLYKKYLLRKQPTKVIK